MSISKHPYISRDLIYPPLHTTTQLTSTLAYTYYFPRSSDDPTQPQNYQQTLQLKPSQTSRWIPPPPLTRVNREARREALPWFRTSLLLSHEDSWVFSGLHLRGAGRVTPEDAATYPCRWRFEGFEPTTDVLEFAHICKGLEKMLRSLVVLLPSTVRHLSLEYDAPLSHLNDLPGRDPPFHGPPDAHPHHRRPKSPSACPDAPRARASTTVIDPAARRGSR